MKKFILSLVFLFAVIMSQAQIQANFTWSDPQCSSGNIVFTDASVGGNAMGWLWEVNGEIEHQGSPTFSYFFPLVTTAIDFQVALYVTAADFSSDNITKTITIYPLPAVTVSPTDPAICQGSSVTLTASGNNLSYLWSNTETTSSISVSPNSTTPYTVIVTDTNQCTNTAVSTITVNPNYLFSQTHSMCHGDSYLWQGTEYSTSTIDTVTYATVHGCDSIYVLNLTVNPTYLFPETHTMCQGDSYLWQGTNYTASTIDTVTYATVHGCDSIYVLNLTVNPNYEHITDQSVCSGDSIQWRGQWYSENDTYTENLISSTGCDSIYVLNLIVNPRPTLVAVITNPSNGVLLPGNYGSVTLSTSDTGTNYWTTKGATMFSSKTPGTGASLSLGNIYNSGSYDVWSETEHGCIRKQGIVVFTETDGSGKIIATPTYGNAQNSFEDNSVKMRVYQITQDINNNDVIIPLGNSKFTTNGNAEFDGLDGNYYLKSELVNIVAYPTVVPIFFYDGPTVDSADIIPVPLGIIMSVTINHPEYPDTTGSNTIGGSVDSLGGAKSTVGIPDQIVILRNVVTDQIISVAVTDENGEYSMPKAPDNSHLQLYVTSFQYQNWTPADLNTSSGQHYTVNFTVNGDNVGPTGVNPSSLERLEFTVYPNPTTNLIHLENVPDGSLLQIFDLHGKLVIYDSRSHKKVLDVSYLPAGQYIIVISHDSSVGTHKMIKN